MIVWTIVLMVFERLGSVDDRVGSVDDRSDRANKRFDELMGILVDQAKDVGEIKGRLGVSTPSGASSSVD